MSEVLTAVQMKIQVFCDMKRCSVTVTDVSEKLAGLTFRKKTLLRQLSRRRQQSTPKRRQLFASLHSVMCQKT